MTQSEYPPQAQGRELIVRSGYVLPKVCVVSNDEVEDKCMRRDRIPWTPDKGGRRLYRTMFAIVGRRYCSLTYGLTRDRLRRYRTIYRLKLLGFVVGFLMMFVTAIFTLKIPKAYQDPLIFGGFALFLVCAIALPFGNRPLRITHRDGKFFWIRGFHEGYLDRFRKSL